MSPAAALLLVAGLALAWRASAFLTGLAAWSALAVVALSVVAGIAVPGAVLLGTAGLWATSQVITRLRRGYWRSAGLARLAR